MSTSTQSIGKKLFRSGASGLISLVVSAIAGLLVMPYVIHHLGDRTFGFWILLGTLLGYFGMLDLGLSRAVMRFVSQALGKDDLEEANKWINAGFFTFLLFSCLGVAASFVVWFVVGWLFPDPSESAVLQRAFFIATFAFSISLPALCFNGIIQAHVRQDIINCIQIGITVFRSAGILLAVYFGGGLVALVLIVACVTLVSSSIIVLAAFRLHGRIHIGIHFFREADYGTFIRYAMASFVSQIADILRFKTAPFIIGGILGVAAVTPFAIAERICNLAAALCGVVLNNLTSGFSTFEGVGGAEDNATLRRAYFFSYKVSCYMGVFAVGMALLLSHAFVIRWMGEEYANVSRLAHILLAGVVFAIIQTPTICLLFSVSKQNFYAASNWLQASLTVGLAIVLTYYFGLTGTAIAISAMAFAVKLLILPLGATSVLGMSIVRYHARHTLPNVALPAVFLTAFYFASRNFIAPDYVTMFIIGITATALFTPVTFFLGFNQSERAFLSKCILPARFRGKTA